jgi:uncharacterized membrane protein YphA (DoxX/SURF4 family)
VPGDLRKVSLLAVIFLVLLRISIGWHLMYEGLWKLGTQRTSTPWTAEGYLKNSTGPLRPTFRAMTGDPDDLKWLDYDFMSQKWQAWRQRFVDQYQLDDTQKETFRVLTDGPDSFEVPLKQLPPGLDLTKVSGVNKQAIRFDAESSQLIVDGKKHLLPSEQDRLATAVKNIAEAKPEAKKVCDQFLTALARVYKLSSRLSYNEKLEALLKQDPDRMGVIIQVKGANLPTATAAKTETEEEDREEGQIALVVQVGEVEIYKNLVERFKTNYGKARTKFEWDHVERQWKELQDKRRDVVGPVQALEKEMQTRAEELLTAKQLAIGPLPPEPSPMQQINQRTMWGLTIIGLLLILGLFTRLSAIGGAVLLFMFYMAMPPWPGIQEIPSIEHNIIVNKVFVEMVALLAIAALPSGKWFGADSIISGLFGRLFGRREQV